jgi:hypothetical protein
MVSFLRPTDESGVAALPFYRPRNWRFFPVDLFSPASNGPKLSSPATTAIRAGKRAFVIGGFAQCADESRRRHT